jgi:hypothetical protein
MAETLDRQVAASADDCKVAWDGSAWALDLTFVNNVVGYTSSTNYKMGCGMRFLNIPIPKGSTINSAKLTLTCRLSRSNTIVNSKLRGEDADNAAAFSDYADYSGRPRTTNQVTWNNIPAWTAETEYDSPDITSIIQEIIDRAGWASGNALVIFWDDHDDISTHVDNTHRHAYSYDSSPAKAPNLHIEYTPPAAGGARSHGYIMG